MNTNTQETQYSDIKVSKSTEKVLKALAAYSTLFNQATALDGLGDDEVEQLANLLSPVRDKLDELLLQSICEQQSDTGNYTYKVI